VAGCVAASADCLEVGGVEASRAERAEAVEVMHQLGGAPAASLARRVLAAVAVGERGPSVRVAAGRGVLLSGRRRGVRLAIAAVSQLGAAGP
jgi:hypothetical protein